MGDVIDDIAALPTALDAAPGKLPHYAPVQRAYVERMMGVDDGHASDRAADVVMSLMRQDSGRRSGNR